MLFSIHRRWTDAFTLIEVSVVFIIIAILATIAVPTLTSVLQRAKRVQASNDLAQIVTAVSAYYTEYGKYPIATNDNIITNTGDLFYTLRAVNGGVANAGNAANPRIIQYLNIPDVKDQTKPTSGIYNGATNAALGLYAGGWYDAWGKSYVVKIDGDYTNDIANPYTTGAGNTPIRAGVVAWSFGPDKLSQTVPGPAANKTGTNADDVISWQ